MSAGACSKRPSTSSRNASSDSSTAAASARCDESWRAEKVGECDSSQGTGATLARRSGVRPRGLRVCTIVPIATLATSVSKLCARSCTRARSDNYVQDLAHPKVSDCAQRRMCTIMHSSPSSVETALRLGREVKRARQRLGLAQSDLSLVAGVSRRTVHAIEHGKPTIRLDALVSVLRAVDLDLEARPRSRTLDVGRGEWDRLVVYLRGSRLGTLAADERPGDYTFVFDSGIARAHEGDIAISVSLPVRSEPYGPREARPFFEGLLPELGVREDIARNLKLSNENSFGLLSALGRDSAGAVVLLPDGEPLTSAGSTEWLTEHELNELIARLPTSPLGISGASKIRLSLAGLQRKAVLVRSGDGTFGLPNEAAPSTHILKPQYPDTRFNNLVYNEAFCMRVAECVGLSVARHRADLRWRGSLPTRRTIRSEHGRRDTLPPAPGRLLPSAQHRARPEVRGRRRPRIPAMIRARGTFPTARAPMFWLLFGPSR